MNLAPAPHIKNARSVQAIMLEVCLALIPAALLHIFWFGPGLLINFAILCVFGLISEYLMLRLRGQPTRQFLTDFSTVVTAVLIAFALPPITPWWVSASAIVFAVVVAKHLYGGLGFNVFNPAMAGYAVVLVSFPRELALWLSPEKNAVSLSWWEKLIAPFNGLSKEAPAWDQITQATPLDQVQIALSQGDMMSEVMLSNGLNSFGSTPWITINLAIVVGGIWLIARKLITWHIPAYTLVGFIVLAVLFRVMDNDSYANVFFHVFSGSLMLAAFFIATDPVSAATSTKGKIIYAMGVGALIYCIRTWGSYPDGVAFAILFMNMFVPLIDYFTVPRAYGHRK